MAVLQQKAGHFVSVFTLGNAENRNEPTGAKVRFRKIANVRSNKKSWS